MWANDSNGLASEVCITLLKLAESIAKRSDVRLAVTACPAVTISFRFSDRFVTIERRLSSCRLRSCPPARPHRLPLPLTPPRQIPCRNQPPQPWGLDRETNRTLGHLSRKLAVFENRVPRALSREDRRAFENYAGTIAKQEFSGTRKEFQFLYTD